MSCSASGAGYVSELVDCRGQGAPGASDVWELACPPPHVKLQLGIPPALDRYAPHLPESTELFADPCDCHCDMSAGHLNCGGLLKRASNVSIFWAT